MTQSSDHPIISIIIIAYNMAREAPRTVASFLPPYQVGFEDEEIEIIVMENGSSHPVSADVTRTWPSSVKYVVVEDPCPSPARALNEGVAMARGKYVCPVIDGARMASPGLLKWALKAAEQSEKPFIASLGTHLGPKSQQESVLDGYNQELEDRLLNEIDWSENGYRLFEIASVGRSARQTWFGPFEETNAPLLTKAHYKAIGGFDEAFDIPGGGIVNHDFLRRATEDDSVDYRLILGEGTFHQFHGGVTTSRSVSEVGADGRSTWQVYADQYKTIRGKPYCPMAQKPLLYGEMGKEALAFAARFAINNTA